jgi:hypothetical protein
MIWQFTFAFVAKTDTAGRLAGVTGAPLFLALFLVGLVLAVFAMLAGVERPGPRGPRGAISPTVSRETLAAASSEISARFHIPIVAAFATSFGAAGYLLARYSVLGTAWQVGVSAAVGACAAMAAVAVVAGWALPDARRDVPDERYLLQGVIARVTDPIDAANAGRIAVQMNGTLHAVRAVSLNGGFINKDAEVVIERIEADTAFVEPWSHVEQRL